MFTLSLTVALMFQTPKRKPLSLGTLRCDAPADMQTRIVFPDPVPNEKGRFVSAVLEAGGDKTTRISVNYLYKASSLLQRNSPAEMLRVTLKQLEEKKARKRSEITLRASGMKGVLLADETKADDKTKPPPRQVSMLLVSSNTNSCGIVRVKRLWSRAESPCQ